VSHARTILDGWTLSAVDPDPTTAAARLPGEIPATIPGTVHTDLIRAGLIADPYLDLNEHESAWIGHTVWSYRTTVQWCPPEDEHTDLVFDGLDTVATVLLNGQEVGRTFNQHRTYRFDLTDMLLVGPNELEVRFDSAWDYAERLQADLGDLPNAYPSPFNFIRKMASNFGWDWGPQLVTAGIWKQVRLEGWSTARLAEVRPTVGLAGETGTVRVDVRLHLSDSSGTASPRSAGLAVLVEVAGQRIEVPVAGASAMVDVRVPDVDVWWPQGMGGQPLYPLRVSLVQTGRELDEWSRRIGFRTASLDTTADQDGSSFTFVINGIPTFIRGANWIPDDCFPSSQTPERYRERIEQALDANLNLLRVWGGGIYESDDFYDICDERGVLVWQDFLFACAAYPEESPISDEVAAEAHDNVLRLASHPSLILWNGCNENIWGWFDWDWQKSIGDRTWGLGYYERILPAIVAELSPGTPYWPGSPYSGSMAFHANDFAHGNVHIWDVWNKVDYTVYGEYEPRFVSEFGFQGPPAWSTIERSIHDQQLTPESPGMLHHQKADDGNGKLQRGLAPHLPAPTSIDDWHFLTQLNQARAIGYAIERYRSQRPHCMGTIVWQLNDCWPVTSWAAIDGYGRRKPLWHRLRRANAERLLTIQPADGLLTLVAVNDGTTRFGTSVNVSRRSLDGAILTSERIELTVDALSSSTATLSVATSQASDPTAEVVVVDVPGSRPITYYFVEDKNLALANADVEVTLGEWTAGEQLIQLSGSMVIRGVSLFPDRIQPDAWVDDVDVDLVPGIPVRITLHTPVPFDVDQIRTAPVLRTVNEVVRAAAFDHAAVELARYNSLPLPEGFWKDSSSPV